MHGKQALEALKIENASLRKALLEQWQEAHYDHCGSWPHDPGHLCRWPKPPILEALVVESND